MTSLWKVEVNNWGWSRTRYFYAASRVAAKAVAALFPAAGSVKYAGRYADERAAEMLQGSVDSLGAIFGLTCSDELWARVEAVQRMIKRGGSC